MELLQIVPVLPPVLSGVGDYALLLARELQARHGVRTHFLNADTKGGGAEEHVAPFVADVVKEHSVAAMRRALERARSSSTVLLHYVGHGYAKRGCPFWLVRALEQWKPHSRARLIVLFHEVSGTGPIWTSGFWTSGMQTALARRLAHLGDTLRITTEVAAERVRAMLPDGSQTPVRVLPVFSTLGEPTTLLSYQERSRHLIIFGSAGWRRDAYTRHLPTLRNACWELRMEKVIDIGSPTGARPALGVPFVEAGALPASEASELMQASTVGFFTYPVPHIGKSTIFAAYCAHGLIPVTFAANTANGDENLRPNVHFLALPDDAAGACDNIFSKAIATAANTWYQQHRLEVHAGEIAQAMHGQPPC